MMLELLADSNLLTALEQYAVSPTGQEMPHIWGPRLSYESKSHGPI